MTNTKLLTAIMFTDVVGYTALMQEDEANALALLSRHRQVLETLTAAHGGEVIQYYGDGSLSIYPSAEAAVRCAIDIQATLRSQSNVPLRIGLHLGDILRKDGHIYGHGVNVAARVQGQGIAGSVLVSERIHCEIANNPELNSLRLGTYTLKNVRDPVTIFALAHPELAVPEEQKEQKHSLAEAEKSAQDNLPKTYTSFIGRTEELAVIQQLCISHQLCTILGPGGIGKTRIAIELGRVLADSFEDGVWFVDLVPIENRYQLAEACCQALHLALRPDDSPIQTLIRHLSDKSLLLILDNCEHLIDASSAVIRRVQEKCDNIHILATSRERLHLPGEQLVVLPSLALPPEEILNDEEILKYESISLFIDRARLVQPGLKPNAHNLPSIVDICAFLDGIPLAIELAAARSRTLAPDVLYERLREAPGFLKNRQREAASRQRTLETMVDWSYQLLDPDEQLLFRRLGIFEHNFDLEKVESVCGKHPLRAGDIADLLELLMDKSLITFAPNNKFRMLEVIKHFARETLKSCGEWDESAESLFTYLLNLTDTAYHEQIISSQAWIERLQSEHEDIMNVLEWFDNVPQKQLALSGNLGWYWTIHFHHAQNGIDILRNSLTRYTKRDLIRGKGIASIANLAFYRGDEDALDWAKKSIEILSTFPNSFELLSAYLTMSNLHMSFGNYREGEEALLQCAAIARKINDQKIMVRVNTWLAYGYIAQGQAKNAVEVLEQNLQRASDEKMVWDLQLNKHLYADCALIQEDFQIAFERYSSALEAAIEVGDGYQAGFEMEGLGMSLAGLGDFKQAIVLLYAAAKQFNSLGGRHQALWWDSLVEKYRNMANKEMSPEEFQLAVSQGEQSEFKFLTEKILEGQWSG